MDAFSYLDVPRSGVMNMAIDDALLEFAERQQAFVLRVYEWSEPTLSLGYFQKLDDRFLHPPGQDLSVVRRATGGGAIVHHHDLTYSLCIPQSRSSVGAAPAIYESVHGSLVTWLRVPRVPAEQWRRTAGEDDSAPTTASPHRPVGDDFLCFRRRSSGDVVAAGHKILGHAQRRSKRRFATTWQSAFGHQRVCTIALWTQSAFAKCKGTAGESPTFRPRIDGADHHGN